MKKQAIQCRTCTAVVAYVEHRDDGDYLRFQFGSPVIGVKNGTPTASDIHSRWFTVNIADELHDVADSSIDVECACAENGQPRKWSFPLRATLDALGARRGLAL